MDINNSDVIVGSGGDPGSDGSTAWVIHRGIVKNLNDLLPANSGWILTDTWGINDAGQIVGNGTLNGQPRGYVLTLGGLQQLATPPKADDLSATTATGAPVTASFQASTTTTSPLTWTIVDEPAHRTAVLNGSRAIYTPAAGFNGQDTFTVQVDDGT